MRVGQTREAIVQRVYSILFRNYWEGIRIIKFSYLNQFLSSYLFAFRKGYIMPKYYASTKKALDQRKYVGAVLSDLPKAFTRLNH